MHHDATSSDAPEHDSGPTDANSRRHLLTAGALAAAAGVVAGVATSQRASAADGDPILIGADNVGDAETILDAGGFSSYGNDDDVGLYGQSDGADGTGVVGISDAGVGVLGGGDIGVFGVGEVGVAARGTVADVVAASGVVGMVPGTAVSSTSPGQPGLLRVAKDGILWFCHEPNQWMRVAGGSSAGAFHAINPGRVYDSRLFNPNPGKLRSGQSRLVEVTFARNSTDGAVVGPILVPPTAKAVTFNITVVNTQGRGNLAVVPGSTATTTTSTVNWPADNIGAIANASLSKLDSQSRVRVICGGSGATDFVLDITGYYL